MCEYPFRLSVHVPCRDKTDEADLMTIVLTTIALAVQLSSIPWAFGDYAVWQIQAIRAAGVLVSVLYIFELLFRFHMHWPL